VDCATNLGSESRENNKPQSRFRHGLAKNYEKVYLRTVPYCCSLETNGERHETPEGVRRDGCSSSVLFLR
jgi:hypothetical protein